MDQYDNIKETIEIIKNKILETIPLLKEGDIIELEGRLGHIRDLQSDNRVYIPTNFPIVFNVNKMYIFSPGTSKNDYKFFQNEIKKLIELEKDSLINNTYEVINKKDITLTGQSSRYKLEDKKIIEHIRKKRLLVFDIFIPNSVYDIRISLSIEEKLPLVDLITEKTFKRERDRISYKNNENISFEFTNINSSHLRETLEVEMEITDFNDKFKNMDIFIKKMFKFFSSRKLL